MVRRDRPSQPVGLQIRLFQASIAPAFLADPSGKKFSHFAVIFRSAVWTQSTRHWCTRAGLHCEPLAVDSR